VRPANVCPRNWSGIWHARTGHTLQHQAPDAWLFHGRVVKIVDGTTVLMPDTPENQAAYPQLDSQAPGLGFRSPGCWWSSAWRWAPCSRP